MLGDDLLVNLLDRCGPPELRILAPGSQCRARRCLDINLLFDAVVGVGGVVATVTVGQLAGGLAVTLGLAPLERLDQ
ncbi:hypothetical protein [Williamsia sp. D3]|uniref:hypothetical protein n=1 Tax=Williamsia sp. D3 TaxID=1313067 RepID=UPI0003D3903E|nr:hypothetical protein [Williamsia sp. D3]ETD30790.1 hypothetical protein W823_22720 [Williamsia sp. D3]